MVPGMRHLLTMIAAIVISPVVWILVALGQDRTAQVLGTGDAGSARGGDLLRPLVLLAGAGILLGLISTLRFSPAGAGLAGVLYAGTYVVLLASPRGLLHAFDYHLSIVGWQADLSTPVRTGTSLLIGAVLLVSVASVARWRRWPRRASDMRESVHAFPGSAAEPAPPLEATPADSTHWIASLRSGYDVSRR